MAMVSADDRNRSADSQHNRWVWSEGWRPPGAQSAFIKWTGWTLAMTMSWWQHHKHSHTYYYYYFFIYPWVNSSQGLKAKKLKSKLEWLLLLL